MDVTVGRRITVGFGVGLLFLVLITALGIIALRGAVSDYAAALTQGREVLTPGLHAESDAREAHINYMRFILTGTESFAQSRDSALDLTRSLIDQVRAGIVQPEDRERWSAALTALAAWDEATRQAIAAKRAGRDDEALQINDTRAFPARRRTRDAILSAVAHAERRTVEDVAAAETQQRQMQLLLLGGALLVLLLGTGSAVLLNRAVTGPLQDATGVLATSAAEILAATQQQASGTIETSRAVSETVSTVEEVTQTSEQATHRARNVADSAQRAADIGKQGRRAVEDSVAAMGAVKEQVESIAESILALAEQAQAIGEIIASVNDIAEQTNLLALNASVEAARAGEHGRGFAVVAAEIKNLAGESKRATVQVRQILGEIQRATSAAVMTTEQGTKEVATVSHQIQQADETIRALTDVIAEASQSSAQIVASAGQQAVGMSQIREAMRSIQEAMQQNLASTQQSERAARDLNGLGGRLLQLVGGNHRRTTQRVVD